MVRCFSKYVLLLLILAASVTPAFAQGGGGTAEIGGTVMDQGKAVLPGATVSATNEATNAQRQVVSGPEGKFLIQALQPGLYTLKAELQGFEVSTRTGLQLQVGQTLAFTLTLSLAGVKEDVTVTAQAPIVETTASQIGTNVSDKDIDSLPSANRSQFSLMQTIPGLVPALQVGSFEGGQFSANGQATTNNLFLVDGQNDNDSRLGGSQGTQARVALDSMAEYQVQTHQYGAEYGGSTGVIVNGVTKSGTNSFAGRAFEYYQSQHLAATDYFLKQAGEENSPFGSNVFGGSLGGPLQKNKAFFFFNYEGTKANEAANLNFPASAAPLAVSYATTTAFSGPNTYARFDYHINGNNSLKFSHLRERILTVRDTIEGNHSILDNATNENDAGDIVYSMSWTSVLNSRSTNEMRAGYVEEQLNQAPTKLFDSKWNLLGFQSTDPFDVGSMNVHPDYTAGPRNNLSSNAIRDVTFDDTVTMIKSNWGGEHSFKAGISLSRNGDVPSISGTNFIGTYTFPGDAPFNAADPTTYPFQFTATMGQLSYREIDHRLGTYLQDKWEMGKKLTLNLGLRYDRQEVVSTHNAFGPRLGFAYDVTGDGKTLIRGGYGKVYQYSQLAIPLALETAAVIAPTLALNTQQVTSPIITGVLPVKPGDANQTACLQPIAGPTAGEAIMSPACKAYLTGLRAGVLAGGTVNTVTAGPLVDSPDRAMAYTNSFSVGLKREITNSMAFSIDYAGNRGRDNTTILDINEGPLNAAGKVTRLGQAVFNPNNVLNLPAAALGATFIQFRQYQTLPSLNTKFNSLELELDKRFSNRWSGRVSYTESRCYDVGAIIVDSHPEYDYGRCARDNRHAFASSANVDIGHGLGGGIVFRAYSGYPINETTGVDSNGDGTVNDRPTKGVDDLVIPIRSAVDSRGVAVRDGMQGERKVILDGRLQYIFRTKRYQAGLFLEVYNLTNHTNFGDPTGARNSAQFMVPIVSDNPRQGQLGVRLTF